MIRRSSPEHAIQAALFQWARLSIKKYPALDLLSCSLNGVNLTKSQAGKAKAAGMLAGEHDVKLPVKRGGYIGLSIELKHGKNKPTKEQLWYGERLVQEGWYVRYCWSWDDAANHIKAYLDNIHNVRQINQIRLVHLDQAQTLRRIFIQAGLDE